MYSTAKMGEAMKTTAETMGQVNKQINPQQLAKTMQEFEKAGMTMEMSDEMSKLTGSILFRKLVEEFWVGDCVLNH